MEKISKTLVSANPGSGKTEDLSTRVAELIKSGTRADDILCITFTNKARDQMEDRIISKLRDITSKIPDIHTFHSLAMNVISQREPIAETIPERYMRYEILKSMDDRKIMNYESNVLMENYPTIVNVGQIVNAIKFLKSFGILPHHIEVQKINSEIESEYSGGRGINGYSKEEMLKLATGFKDIFQDYENSKLSGELDYNDLLIKAVEYAKLNFKPYNYVFIDEVQDMSETEHELVKLVGSNIYAVGDVKQAIFGFQGGNVRAYREMQNSEEYEKRFMEGTRRLPEEVKEYCKNFYRNLEPDFLSQELDRFTSFSKEKGKVDLLILSDMKDVEDAIPSILKGIDEKESVGIIVRTNEQANSVSDYLNIQNIDHQKVSGTKGDMELRKEICSFLGGIYGNSDDIVPMIYSSFSQVPLADAMQMAEKLRFNSNFSTIIPEYLLKTRELYGSSKRDILKLFKDYLIPYSIKLGENAFETTKDIYLSLPIFLGRLGSSGEYSLSALQRYILQENNRESVEEIAKRICVITVHKAKGLEFKHVIYIPKFTEKKNLSAIDMVVDSILNQNHIDYDREDRRKEENRIDFVALSRTEKTLTIMVTKKDAERYNVQPAKKVEFLNRSIANEFISLTDIIKREQEKVVNNPWMVDYLKRRMNKFNNLSFTMLGQVKDLEKFVESYILGIRTSSGAMTFGSDIHAYIENYIKEHKNPPILEDEKMQKTWSNFIAYDKFVRDVQKGEWIGSEMKFKQKVSDVFPQINTPLTIDGRIDGLYKYMNGNVEKIVIVDFKTSKKESRDHVNQLSLYAKLYSLENGVDMENIESEISYLSLRNTKVNIGEIDKKWDRVEHTIEMRALENVRDMVEKFVNYRNSVDSLVRDIIAVKGPQSRVFLEFQRMLKLESESTKRKY